MRHTHGPILGTPAAMRSEPPLDPPDDDASPDCEEAGHDFPGIPARSMRMEGGQWHHLWRCRRCGHEIDDL